ncbi:methylcrotonoyl-CoA carboxylase, partial [bacterium]|nr:methylcrotonoyl-CoA carboxylase [bacterium]
MTLIRSHADTRSDEYKANFKFHTQLNDDLNEKLARIRSGGGEKARARHADQNKIFVRDRIALLLDPGTPFLEIAPYAADGVYEDSVPAAGVVAGIGRVSGVTCMIVANDATVKGGTYYPLTVKKHLRAQEVALENR